MLTRIYGPCSVLNSDHASGLNFSGKYLFDHALNSAHTSVVALHICMHGSYIEDLVALYMHVLYACIL